MRIRAIPVSSAISVIYKLFLDLFWYLQVPISSLKFPTDIHKLFAQENRKKKLKFSDKELNLIKAGSSMCRGAAGQ